MRRAGLAILAALAGCSQPIEEAANAIVANAVENAQLPEPAANAADPQPANEAAPADALPADVRAFVERRQGCEHWAGEPGWDKEREKQIADAVKELCPGIDKALADLRAKYAGDAKVTAALKEYEPLGMD